MVARWIGTDRVRAHLEVPPVEPRRYGPGYDKILECQFRLHRLVDADEEGAVGSGQPLSVVGRDELDTTLDRRAEG